MNLAINGIDAMHDCRPGEAQMLISTALIDGSAVRVSVADSGTGVPPDALNKIFDAFYTTKGHGTGLGLSIARTIVETYGGKIWAENRPAGGLRSFSQCHCPKRWYDFALEAASRSDCCRS
jgi:signal transduction histidine kinase